MCTCLPMKTAKPIPPSPVLMAIYLVFLVMWGGPLFLIDRFDGRLVRTLRLPVLIVWTLAMSPLLAVYGLLVVMPATLVDAQRSRRYRADGAVLND